MNLVLLIAFHFPPIQGSSGVQRTLRFARHLPEFGWEPLVLTASPSAYEHVTDDQINDIPAGVRVIRAPALDTARHLRLYGHHLGFLARPDRWITWWLSAVPAGLAALRRHRPAALWSTFPIATAHRIGSTLQKLSGLPWIADFRDPMAQEDYPDDPATRRCLKRIESRTLAQARVSTFTTPGALRACQTRYPELAERMALVENGYDEESFSFAVSGARLNPGSLTLLHSGIVYASERDPAALFAALRLLKAAEPQMFARLKVRFRAPVYDDMLRALARQNDVVAAIEILPPIGYREALSEMLSADGLMILQATNCNAQVPAKLYEYLRARRPIVAFTDPSGETAHAVRRAGISAIAPLDDPSAIREVLRRFIAEPSEGTLAAEAAIAGASRRARTAELARLLDRAVATQS